MEKYGQGVYRIIHAVGGWCVAKLAGRGENGQPIWHAISNKYLYRGWAQAFARRRKLHVQNYESFYT